MRKKPIYFLIILILSVVELSLLDYFKFFHAKPNLLLIAVIVYSLLFAFELKWALGLALFAGFLKDTFSLGSFGINTFLFPLWSFLVIRVSKKIPLDKGIIRVLLVFIVVLLNNIASRLVFSYLGNLIGVGMFLRKGLLESLYTACVSPLLFKAFYENKYN